MELRKRSIMNSPSKSQLNLASKNSPEPPDRMFKIVFAGDAVRRSLNKKKQCFKELDSIFLFINRQLENRVLF